MGNVPVTSGSDAQKEQAKAASQQRQAEIRRDTEKMFQLTTELRDYLEEIRPRCHVDGCPQESRAN